DTPTGVAVDSNGNVYIADSHNNRIREISGGTITTIAGTGVAGFSGDGAAATLAQLADPTSVAVDASGNVYIADTNNQRIRKITGTTISTIAGTGEETFAGDGGAATAAVLDSPTGVAVDANSNVYIADRHNQRIRMVTPTGTISTIAGSGSASFSGSFAGDGGSATAASLAKPSGVSVDAAGNVYIADTGNQRIREVTAGGSAINTVVGSGQQGFGGDTTTPSGVNLNMPKSAAVSATGTIAVADTLNERVRSTMPTTLAFATAPVGGVSTSQSVTLANTGTASITLSSGMTGPFTVIPGGTCSAAPVTLAVGSSCTQFVAFAPTAAGATSGSILYSGTGIVPSTILFSGTGTQASTITTLTASATNINPNQSVILTASVASTTSGVPTGTATFFDNGTMLGAATLSSGVATYTASLAPASTHVLTVSYSGDANFIASSAVANVVVTVGPLSFSFTSTGSLNQTVAQGKIATYTFQVTPNFGIYASMMTFSITGLPPGATATFTPSTVAANSGAQTVVLTIQTAQPLAKDKAPRSPFGPKSLPLFALLLLPLFGGRKLRRKLGARLVMMALLVGGLAGVAGMTGCGTGRNGFLLQQPATYTMTVTATTGSLQQSQTLTLTVQ
ncbi:MAG: Ig-like domain repeat protein, partial [Bryocella sp.]